MDRGLELDFERQIEGRWQIPPSWFKRSDLSSQADKVFEPVSMVAPGTQAETRNKRLRG
jgi:hypothetical protein